MKSVFGTDGVRGVYGEDFNLDFIKRLTKSVGVYLLKGGSNKKVLIATDTRVSKQDIEKEVYSVLNSLGIDTSCAGIIPTPALHYLVRANHFDMGIMITASHNTGEYNGLKFITKEGYKFNDSQEEEVTKIFYEQPSLKENIKQGKNEFVSFNKQYEDYIKKADDFSFNGIKVALDCANGASFSVAPKVFSDLGAEVFCINNSDNGKLINKDCGSTHTEAISSFIKSCGADVGFSFDGDADRVNVCFASGEIMSGEALIFLCSNYLKDNGKLKANEIITPYVTNCGLDKSLEKFGICVQRVGVGGKFIQQKLLENNLSFGAEDNGHIVWGDYNLCSDGLLTALFVTKIMKQGYFEKIKELEIFKQAKRNVRISNDQKEKFLSGELDDFVESKKNSMKDGERIIVRASGTEPLIRVIVEGFASDLEKIATEIENAIKNL